MRSGFGYGRGFKSARLKIALFAPMPSASLRTAIVVKPGLLRSVRSHSARLAQAQRAWRLDEEWPADRLARVLV
jgi:hypothetical protein